MVTQIPDCLSLRDNADQHVYNHVSDRYSIRYGNLMLTLFELCIRPYEARHHEIRTILETL